MKIVLAALLAFDGLSPKVLPAAPAQGISSIKLSVPARIVLGEPTALSVQGVRPGSLVRLHALRRTIITEFRDGKRIERPVVVHAWADFRADRSGEISVDRSAPLAGTYRGADRNGLLWSGWPIGDRRLEQGARPALGAEGLTDNGTLLVVPEVNGALLAPHRVALIPFSERIQFRELSVALDGVSGVFAAPIGAKRLPTIIELHGSEGGSMASARTRAGILAERGFAVLALNYVAYSWTGGIPGVEPTLANVPIETLDRARTWLIKRPEVKADRIALLGGSKGAELALVAATRLKWPRAIVGCVPSDVVWAGYGREARAGELLSSWSWAGAPLPFIPYERYEDVFSGKATAAEVHVRSRLAATKQVVGAARIPVERISAPILLLGSGKDQVWPSASMATAVQAKMRDHRNRARVMLKLYPEATHGICGTGSAPQREDGVDLAADAMAGSDAFRTTIEFLKSELR